MASLPWRIVVVTDLGVETERLSAVDSASLDSWMAARGLKAALPGGASLAIGSLDALAPAAVRAALGPAATAPAIDAVLHDPRVQRTESAWRGLRLLLSHVADPVRVEVLAASRKALVERFRSAVYEPGMRDELPMSLILLDYEFTGRGDDLAALATLAGMAADLQAPVVAHAGAGFFELRYLVQAVAVQDLANRLTGPAHAGWAAFQKTDEARWLCLTLNRFLQREPWSGDAHQERCVESEPDSYLWGRGVWLVGASLARSARTYGHPLDLSGAGGRFEKQPTRDYPVKANEAQALAVEIPFAEMQMLTLAHAAFTPLIGPMNQPTVLLPLVTTTHRFTHAKLTLEGTLAYQLTAARIAQVCGAIAGQGLAGTDEDVTARLRASLTAELGGLLGEKGPEALATQVLPAERTCRGGPRSRCGRRSSSRARTRSS